MKTKQLPEGWQEVELGKICEIYQPKTVSKKEMKKEGKFPVFGANGIIGYFDKYNHEEEELLIGCRGSCGSVIISKPKSWITGNSMIVHITNKEILNKYLFYYFKSFDFSKIITGTSQPQIIRQPLVKLKIPIPQFQIQKQIVSILEKAEKLKQKRENADELTKKYLQSVFYEMFGDPKRNNKNWSKCPLKEVVEVVRESIAPEKIENGEKYIGLEDIESESGRIIKVNNVSNGDLKSNKFIFDSKCLLYGKLRPYLNKIALPNFKGICSTDILPIRTLKNKSNRYYIAFLLRNKYYIQLATDMSVGANLPRLSPKSLEYFEIFSPPLQLQQKFASIVKHVEKLKEKQKKSKEVIDEMFNALMQKAFKGGLVR